MNRPYQPFPDTSPPVAPADPWGPRIEADRERLLEAQNKPRHKLKEIGEGLLDWAAAGVGIPLHRIMHPRGSATDQANQQLATDIELQKQAGNAQEQQAGIKLRGRQAQKIQDELDNPDTSEADKAELQGILEGVKVFEGQAPTPDNDAAYAQLRAKAAKRGITLPATYGPKAATVKGGGFNISPGQRRIEIGPDGKPKVVYEAPDRPEKPEPADTTDTWANLEGGFRANAQKAQDAAQKAEQAAKDYIASKKAIDPNFDAASDPNAASLIAESKRQREFALEQTKKADEAAFKKTEASGKRKGGMNATEKKIYDAAKGKGLDPDEAIRRYRAGKY